MTAPIHDIASRFHLRRSGARHVGQCPKCGGSDNTDRFVLFDDGGYRCFSCGFKGDRIKWLREMEGMSCKEAHDIEGKGCSVSCPNYGPCRDGQEATVRRRRAVAPPAVSSGSTVPLMAATTPTTSWLEWSEALVAKSRANLAHLPEACAWLAKRGISAAAIDRFELGWLTHDTRIDRASIGVQVEPGKEKLWIPGGLVIPTHDRQGAVIRLRIRRTPESRERFLPDRKYEWIRGSASEPMVLGQTQGPRGVVIVEAELDAIAVASSNPDVAVIALGTVAGGMTAWQHELCRTAPVVLVALDADQAKDGNIGAGQQAVRRWTATFRQARYWPTPAGKDPGDYVKDHGGDLRAWIIAGLPPVVDPVVKESLSTPAHFQDQALSPGSCFEGEKGKDVGVEGPTLVLTDGREIWLTDDPEKWEAWRAMGRIAFSSNELARLQSSLVGLDAAAKVAAVSAACNAKELFCGYIRRGEVAER